MESTAALTIARPNAGPLEQALAQLAELGRAVRVTNVEEHEAALQLRKRVTAFRREVADLFDPVIKKAHEAHKGAIDAKKTLDVPAADLEERIDAACVPFESRQRLLAEEQERALQAQARKEEEDRVLAEAQAAQDEGDEETAMQIVSEPVLAPIVRVAPAVAKVAGVTTRDNWRAEVTDFGALIRHAAAHPEFHRLLKANEAALNGMARSLRSGMRIPGVRAVNSTVRQVRR